MPHRTPSRLASGCAIALTLSCGSSPKPNPELTKLQAFDRQMHIERSMEAGLTREEAERHADSDLADRDDSHE